MAKINIMFTRFSAFYTPLIATMAAGFLQEEGLEPSYAIADGTKNLRSGLADGSVHMGQSAVSSSWAALDKGQTENVVHFAQINLKDGFFVTGREPDPDFTWDKLVGRKVLVDHGLQPMAMFKYAVHKKGVDYAKIDAIDAGGGAAIDRAFRDGKADYVHQQGPAPQQLEHDGKGHVLASVGEAIGPVAFSSLASTRDWLKTDMAQAFMRAYRKSRRYVNEAPAEEIAKAEQSFFPGIDQQVLAKTIRFYQGLGNWDPEARIPRDAYEVALDVFEHSGLIKKRHPYDAVCTLPPDEG